MRKASSLSECWMLRVRRSGSRSSSLGNRALSSGRRWEMRERSAWIRFSWSCSTPLTSTMPERSARKGGERQQGQHTSTTAMNRAISSGSRPREPSFSLKSNMASKRQPIPRARRDASEYVCPLRKVTVLSLGSNSEQNLTISTWAHKIREGGE
ncbi:hypothetical protein CRUP_036396, partial [Coryphaenoides rupestris]